ncbi:MAG: sensor histidine kinase, partial [Nevskiales bacterium]
LQHHAGADSFHLHVLGMWLNFLLSALLVTIFVTAIAEAVRRRDRSLATAREEALRNEQILAIGTLAAGAVHELSTPLSIMAVTIGELRDQHQGDPVLTSDLRLLRKQIDVCRQQLDILLSNAGQNRAAGAAITLSLEAFLREIVERCRLMRPELVLHDTIAENLSSILIAHEATLAQAILAALNNAADASIAAGQPVVSLRGTCDGDRLNVEIEDRGSGLRPEQLARAGRGIFSTKPQGYGLGLVLSHATLERLGGEMRLEPRTGGGTLVRIILPLQSLQPGCAIPP